LRQNFAIDIGLRVVYKETKWSTLNTLDHEINRRYSESKFTPVTGQQCLSQDAKIIPNRRSVREGSPLRFLPPLCLFHRYVPPSPSQSRVLTHLEAFEVLFRFLEIWLSALTYLPRQFCSWISSPKQMGLDISGIFDDSGKEWEYCQSSIGDFGYVPSFPSKSSRFLSDNTNFCCIRVDFILLSSSSCNRLLD